METKWILLAVLLALIAMVWVLTRRCSSCKRLRVMRPTEKTRTETLTGSTFVEWRCQSCGYAEWRALARTSSGGQK